MKPLPMHCRMLRALELAPMTIRQMARCLDADEKYVRRIASELSGLGAVFAVTTRRGETGRSAKVWSIHA